MADENGSDESISQIVECPFSWEDVDKCGSFSYGITNLGEGCGTRVLKTYENGKNQKIVCGRFR